jgi:preprotein translocase subunit SecY
VGKDRRWSRRTGWRSAHGHEGDESRDGERRNKKSEIKKYGGFIPGIRPGAATAAYLNYILVRITLAGGIFLGLIAILPSIVSSFTGVTTLAIGGTSLLIVVSVVLDTAKQFESKLIERNYDKFLQR